MREAGQEVEMPSPGPLAYLVDMLMRAGPCIATSDGPLPLTYQEIASWSEIARVELEGHEAEFIRSMSQQYCSDWAMARKPHCPDPEGSETDVGEQFGALLKRLK